MSAFIAGLLGLSFGAGWFVVSAVVGPLFWSGYSDDWPEILRRDLPFVAGACACGAPLAVWIAQRHRLRSLPCGALTCVAIGCWMWSGLCVAGAEFLLLL
ncbi:MAG TPA: hypothetical protein VFF69_03495 [Phycisphaerales bacterium]|nr:hypothetical protein [Phycisphaerales bacterium]